MRLSMVASLMMMKMNTGGGLVFVRNMNLMELTECSEKAKEQYKELKVGCHLQLSWKNLDKDREMQWQMILLLCPVGKCILLVSSTAER